MGDEEKNANGEEKTGSYPIKYWWVVLVAVPVLLGALKFLPEFLHRKPDGSSSGSSIRQGEHGTVVAGNSNILNSDLSTRTYVINLAAIEKEYAAVKNEPLQDEELKKEIRHAISLLESGQAKESAAMFEQINQKVSLPSLQTDLGVAYQKAGKTADASRAFARALDQDPNYQAAHHNLGLIKAAGGQLEAAQQHFEKAGEIGESKMLTGAVHEALQIHNHELEPNDTPSEANLLPLQVAVGGSIGPDQDKDYFRITTPPKYRDIIQIRLENPETMLQPGLQVFDAKKSAHSGAVNNTAGGDLEHTLIAGPEATYYLQVHGRYSTMGRYRIRAEPLKRYDDFEPNDSILEPAAIEIGQKITANIMDAGDSDFYRFTAGAQGATVKIHLENRSDTLKPGIATFDGNKSALSGNHDDTSGANVDHTMTVQPGATHFVQVYPRYGTAGAYELTLNQE